MRYFTYIAEQSFKTSESGERLFYRAGPWARPYVIPDAETERRIYWKLVWQLRIMLGAMIFAMPFAFMAFPNLVMQPLYFAVLIIAAIGIFYLASVILFAPEVKKLHRASTRLPLKHFYREMGRKHSFLALALGLGVSLALAGNGLWLLMRPQFLLIGWFNLIFFGLCSVAWGYAVVLKRANASRQV